jgi:hypothetical protein
VASSATATAAQPSVATHPAAQPKPGASSFRQRYGGNITLTPTETTLVDVFADVFVPSKYKCKYKILEAASLPYLLLYLRIANTSANTEAGEKYFFRFRKY